MNKIASVLTGNSSLKAKLCLPVLASLALLTLVLFVGACSDDVTEVPFPVQPLPEARDWLFTVFGTGPDDIFFGGARGALFHFNGNFNGDTLKAVDVGTNKAITRIWGSGDGTLYATGHGGVILRNSGGSWSHMSSGTTKDLYSIGRFQGDIYASGFQGAFRKLNGSSWGGTHGLSWILDNSGAPTDTLEFSKDIMSLTTVNSFFIGGAYIDPNFVGIPVDMDGTKGGVFALAPPDTMFPAYDPKTGAYEVLPDWILRPLSGEQIIDSEWMLSSTSDPADLSRNYLGTSEGWLFQLSVTQGDTVWTKFSPSVTISPGGGIQDIWLDPQDNLYMVTDEGAIVYQTWDYKFKESGERTNLYDGTVTLTGIWGTDPGNFYVVGYMDEKFMRCSHDPVTGDFSFIEIDVEFPDSKAMDSGPAVDKFGRPVF